MTNQKIALITGGSRGLGRDMALNVAKNGVGVIITYHSNEAAANKVVSLINSNGGKAQALQLDSSNTKIFTDFFNRLSDLLESQFGKKHFDYLVNNAGTGIGNSFEATTEEQFDEMMNIHLKGAYFFTQKALPYLNDGGSIVNVSSGLARFSFPGMSAYATMKGAIEVFTRYLAKELGERGITANVVAPGAIATDFAGGTNKTNEEKRAIISKLTALGRIGEAEDIGPVVAFLCSDAAHWVNGQRIEASGGTLL